MGSREKTDLHARRRTRQEVVAFARAHPLEKWPCPPDALLKQLDQLKLLDAYARRRQAVEYYVDGRKGKFIKDTTRLSVTVAKRLYESCIEQKLDGSIFGFYACLPSKDDAPTTGRRTPKPPVDPALEKKGPARKFAYTDFIDEDNGRRRKILEELFRTRRLLDGAPYPVLTQSLVFKAFLKLCTKEGIKDDEYPLNQDRKSEWGITNHWKKWNAAHAKAATNNQYGPDAAKEQDVDMAAANSGEMPPLPKADGYGRAELDEHELHAIGLLSIPTRSGVDIVVGLRRAWALILRETGAGAILSTCISYRAKYDKNDVLRLIRKALKATPRMTNSSFAKLYLPGAAYPSEVGFELHRWQVTAYDSDPSHLSIAEQADLRKLLGEVENERVGEPVAHAYAESINARIADFFESLPSGTGSNPQDPARRDPEKAAEQYPLHISEHEEVLDVWGRNFNVTQQKGLDGRTPLQHLRAMQVQGRVFVSAADAFGDFELFKLLPQYEAHITFSRNTGKRIGSLGVQLFGGWYTSSVLAKEARLRSTTWLKCTVYVEEDARYAWVVPDAFPEEKFFVKVTNRDLRDFPHSLDWRRIAEAHGTNATYEAESAKASTLLGVLEILGARAKAGDATAAAEVSRFAGFMAQVQNGLLHYVSTQEEREALDAERPAAKHSADPAAGDAKPQAMAAAPGGQAVEEGGDTATAVAPEEGPGEEDLRAGQRQSSRASLSKALAKPVPIQGQTPHRPLPSKSNPFGLIKK